MQTKLLSVFNSNHHSLAPLLLRLVIGIIFIGHGYGKLFADGNPGNFAAWLASLGLEPSYLLAVFTGLAETFGGLLIILGLLTRFAAASCIIVMTIAIAFVHIDNGMFGQGGYEFQLLLWVSCLFFIIQGTGKWSLDSLIRTKAQ